MKYGILILLFALVFSAGCKSGPSPKPENTRYEQLVRKALSRYDREAAQKALQEARDRKDWSTAKLICWLYGFPCPEAEEKSPLLSR
jgi:hypothetical protein